MRYINYIPIACLLLLLVAALPAQSQGRVKIELLIFDQNNEDMLENLEQLSAISRNTLPPAVQLFSSTERVSIRSIRPINQYRFINEYDRIQNDEELDFLYRVAWTQPRYGDNNAVYVSLLPQPQGSLRQGIARLSQGQLYLLELIFQYDPDSNDFSVERNQPEDNKSITINMRGVVPDNKTHYFDHALIGALIRVTPLKTASAPEADIAPESIADPNAKPLIEPTIEAEEISQ